MEHRAWGIEEGAGARSQESEFRRKGIKSNFL